MADLAGALAAIQQRLKDSFADPMQFPNQAQDDATLPWPPIDAVTKAPVLWIYCEFVDLPPTPFFGRPGNQTIMEQGLAKFYVMVSKGSGEDAARAKAVAIGEAFRQATFYNQEPPAFVRTKTPRVGKDPLASEDGATVAGACCTVPYEFWHRA